MMEGAHLKLRAPEPEDLDLLMDWENNPAFWTISQTRVPFSRWAMKRYIENAHSDILSAQQMRLMMVCKQTFKAIGAIDLFEYDAINRRAGVGILIGKEADRGKGFGSDALAIVARYAKEILALHQLYAHVLEDNVASCNLFEKEGFLHTGTRKDWILEQGTFKHERIYQKVL